MSNWFKYSGRRKIIREDRKYLEATARRLLKSYLLAEWLEKTNTMKWSQEQPTLVGPKCLIQTWMMPR